MPESSLPRTAAQEAAYRATLALALRLPLAAIDAALFAIGRTTEYADLPADAAALLPTLTDAYQTARIEIAYVEAEAAYAAAMHMLSRAVTPQAVDAARASLDAAFQRRTAAWVAWQSAPPLP